MFVNRKINVTLSGKNIPYYINLNKYEMPYYEDKNGNKKIKRNSRITIDIEDLPHSSEVIVEVYCDGCLERNKKTIIRKRYDSLIRHRARSGGIDRCKECGYAEISIKKNKDGEMVYSYFIERKLIPMFTAKDYMGIYGRLQYKCQIHDDVMQTTTYNTLKQSVYGCKICFIENLKETLKTNISDVYDYFYKHNLIPLFTRGEYLDVNTKLAFLCSIHSDTVQYITLNNLKGATYPCKNCYKNNISGENSRSWKGGITSINLYLRNRIVDWKRESFRNSNFSCVITGSKKELKIHHIHGFDLIVKEVFENTKLALKHKTEYYSNEELMLLENECIKLHDKYGLGICLNDKIHKLFHSHYGYSRNNLNQFKAFLFDVKKGKFNDFFINNNFQIDMEYIDTFLEKI